MKRSTAIHAILGVIIVVMLCALPTVVWAQGAIGIFCHGTATKELDRAWNLERDGTGDPGKKYFNYLYAFSDNKTGKYTLEFSSYWGFKFHSYYRARNTDKWAPYNMENPRVLTDRNGRRFNYVGFTIDAPRFSPSELLVQINAIPFYDGNQMLSTVVWSRDCTQGPSTPSMGCRWVEGSVFGQPTTRWCECNGRAADPSKCPR